MSWNYPFGFLAGVVSLMGYIKGNILTGILLTIGFGIIGIIIEVHNLNQRIKE
ncbi:hypothetical protein LCGC14_0970170 [marine sediment metagenome]|uniref:Uncharacterized protein n=1 Tax=marine sediment metagenome TaxID=412755 RepID=A0A0F9NGD3_9ZZZZ